MLKWLCKIFAVCLLVAVSNVLVVNVLFSTKEGMAQDTNILSKRIERLEQGLVAVQRQLYNGVAETLSSRVSNFDGDIATRLQQHLVDMEVVISSLTGQTEEVKFELNRVNSQLGKLKSDVDYRLGELERRFQDISQASTSGAATSSAVPRDVAATRSANVISGNSDRSSRAERESIAAFGKIPGQEESPTGGLAKTLTTKTRISIGEGNVKVSARDHYKSISVLLNKSDYLAAEKLLLAFLETYPENPLAGNAQYWLGETYYMRGDFRQAAIAFARGYQKYAKSSKAAANVLKLGMSLAKLDRIQEACTVFSRLTTEFSNASSILKQRATLERKRLGCK